MTGLNPKQFRQQRLFAPLGMTKKPHQQTPLEFANSPRTWWHASSQEDFDMLRADAIQFEDDEDGTGQGFHVGTLASAHERMTHRSYGSDTQGYLHPVRFTESALRNSKDDPYGNSGGRYGADRGEDWSAAPKPQFYENRYEDKGSVSAVLESPNDVMHHTDFVREALDEGGIPSGQAEYLASKRDAYGDTMSPGFPRSQFAAVPVGPGGVSRRLRPREDALDSPVTRAHRALGVGEPVQQEMEFPGYQDVHTFMKHQRGER